MYNFFKHWMIYKNFVRFRHVNFPMKKCIFMFKLGDLAEHMGLKPQCFLIPTKKEISTQCG